MALPEATEDSWLAQQRKREATGTPDDDANVVRAARSILNKLTVEKFESLFEQLTMCGIKQPHHISILMREVFEKATTQHHFIPMYAELCVQLEKDPRIAAVVEDADQLQGWRVMVATLVKRYIGRYGLEAVATWRFEPWNESDHGCT